MKKFKASKILCSLALMVAMILTMGGLSNVASAAKKTPKLSTKKVTIGVGKTKKVTVKNKSGKVKWTTKNKKVATVKNGKIKGVKTGSTKVTCKVGSKKLTVKVSVKAPSLSAKSVSVKAGASKKVTIKNAAAGQKLTWASKDKSIATVKSGKITGVKAGSTTVTCKVKFKNGKKSTTKTHKVSVKVTGANTVPGSLSEAQKKALAEESNLTTVHKSANGLDTKDNGKMRKELSTLDLTKYAMGIGWNLGNQMEESNWLGTHTTIAQCETNAGNPKATQKTFDGLKSYGINTVRVPVAWSNLMSTDGKYTINKDLLKRIEEIINYALNDEMYVIINIHWDGGWWGMFGAEEMNAASTPIRDEAWKKYKAFWTQIAERYKEYSDHLIFEGANEELSGRLNDDYTDPMKGQSNQTGKLAKDANDIYKLVNQINQTFVDIVRASGGNNKYRHLLIPGTGNESCVIGGYAGDIYKTDGTMDARYQMPKDSAENGKSKLSVSVHFYDPTDYGISASSATPWGYRDSWGTDKDKKDMRDLLGRMKKFTDEGYGVIVGECGCVKGYKDGVIDYFKELFNLCKEFNFNPVMWDEGHYYNRSQGYFSYGDVGQLIADLTGSKPQIPSNAKLQYTGISKLPLVENTDPKVVYTWEGEFMRHLGDAQHEEMKVLRPDDYDTVGRGIGKTTSVSDGLTAVINDLYWNISVKCDWSQFKEPCVRVYPMDNDTSKNADLQVGYCLLNDKDAGQPGKVENDKAYDPGNGQFWDGKYLKLEPEFLKDHPWLWLTTNTYTGASYVKIEVCDGAYNADGTEFKK